MLTVRHAAFRGMRDFGGQTLAEVEVHTTDPAAPGLLAYFREGPKGYQLVRIVSNDASAEIDWYDNDLHQAFGDVTQLLFSGPSHLALNDRHQFGEQVLETDGVRKALDLQFRSGGG